MAAVTWSKARNTGLPGATRSPAALVLCTRLLRQDAALVGRRKTMPLGHRYYHGITYLMANTPFPPSELCYQLRRLVHPSYLPARYEFNLGEVFHFYWHRGC
jgi:hypothetical protein